LFEAVDRRANLVAADNGPEQHCEPDVALLEGNVRQWIVAGVGRELDVRDRPREFAERGPIAKSELLERLRKTVDRSIEIVSSQSADAVIGSRRIQGFDTTVAEALVDSVAHFRGHAQEIISLTRQQLQGRYEFYFVPQSAEQGAANPTH
jgi:hypothetical protein